MKFKVVTGLFSGILFASLLSLSSGTAQAADLDRGWAGVLGGVSIPSATGTSARALWGLTAGAKLGSEYGLGAYFEDSSKSETIHGVSGQSFNYSLYGIQASYHFEGDAIGAYFGARVGISKVKSGVNNVSPVNYGVFAGYDYKFVPNFSLGGELAFMGVGSGDDATHVDGFTMLNFTAAAKFWF